MKDKKFHEALKNDLILLDKPKSYKIFDYYSNKIPTNIIGNIESNINKKKTNQKILTDDEIQKLFEKTNLNIGKDNTFGFYEKMLIKEKNYFGLFDLLKKKYPYNKQDNFLVYTYAKKLCGKSLKQKDYEKINSDINYLEKKMEKNDLNRITFTRNQNFTLKFE